MASGPAPRTRRSSTARPSGWNDGSPPRGTTPRKHVDAGRHRPDPPAPVTRTRVGRFTHVASSRRTCTTSPAANGDRRRRPTSTTSRPDVVDRRRAYRRTTSLRSSTRTERPRVASARSILLAQVSPDLRRCRAARGAVRAPRGVCRAAPRGADGHARRVRARWWRRTSSGPSCVRLTPIPTTTAESVIHRDDLGEQTRQLARRRRAGRWAT